MGFTLWELKIFHEPTTRTEILKFTKLTLLYSFSHERKNKAADGGAAHEPTDVLQDDGH